MKHFKYTLFFIIPASFWLVSCVKESNFPTRPVIKFESFELFGNDSAKCIISFTDGDGDIGFSDNDTTANSDLKMKYLYKESDGKFYPFDANSGTTEFDTLFYNNRVPDITPDGQYKALEGKIEVKLTSAPLFNPLHEIVKFEITLTDRAGHVSNTVFTNPITVIP